MAGFLVAPFAGSMVLWRGKPSPWAAGFPARPWLLFSAGWLTLSAFSPSVYSLPAGVTQAVYYLAIMSPAFWGGEALVSPRQIGRLMAVLFLCNALSATLGLGQVYYPERLNPPDPPVVKGVYEGEDLKFELADGRKIFRPCGLTDSPGSATHAGRHRAAGPLLRAEADRGVEAAGGRSGWRSSASR